MAAVNRFGDLGPAMGMLVPVAGASDQKAVGGASVAFDTTLDSRTLYVYTADVDTYIRQGASPTASAGDGSMFVPAGMPVLIDGAQGASLAQIQKSTGGVCTLQQVAQVA